MAPAAAAHLACFYLAQFTSLRKSPPESYRHMKGRARNAEEYGEDNSPDASYLVFDTHFFASLRNVQELSPLLHALNRGYARSTQAEHHSEGHGSQHQDQLPLATPWLLTPSTRSTNCY
ncbi:hypothetical protein M440DRAFT_300866 [Trichoderma longibrachiatum ATCC 18648]|uniref:Uncharacterized protein n=1 Tax=Trichoderma longibrachiatum ATCC 18648 TaxID=983965 RepID=A0A2T4C561_TRILO|nr:hypothetical protein M440DRAFT_300866 [Trichoderma longibrachiatum ATCC 18648]